MSSSPTSSIWVHGMEVDASRLPPGLLQDPPKMSHNPVHCPKFVVNMFKAGSGKCRDCGHEWYQHEGVIDRQVAEKFMQIWTHAQQKAIHAALEPIKTMADMREEKKRALIAAAKLARGENSGRNRTSSNASSGGGRLGPMSNDEAEEEEFKFYSKEEFLAKERSTNASNTPIAGNASPLIIPAKPPAKVVNLINFSEDPPQSSTSPVVAGEEIQKQVLLLTNALREKDALIEKQRFDGEKVSSELELQVEKLRSKVNEQDAVIASNKATSRELLDQIDVARKESEATVLELKNALENANSIALEREISHLNSQLEASRTAIRERDAAISRLEEARSGEIEGLKKSLESKESRISELIGQLETSRSSILDKENSIAELNRRISETETSLVGEGEKLKSNVQMQQSEISELAGQLETFRRNDEEKDRVISQLTAQIDGAETTVHGERDELQKSIAMHQREISELTGQLEAFRRTDEEKDRVISQLTAQISEAETTVHGERDELQKSIAMHQREISELAGQLETFRRNDEEKDGLISKLTSELGDQQVRLSEVSSQLEASRRETQEHALKLEREARKDGEISDLKSQVETAESSLEASQREASEIRKCSQQQQALISQLSSKVAELQEEIDELGMKLSETGSLQKKVEELEANIQSVEAEREDVVLSLQAQLGKVREDSEFDHQNEVDMIKNKLNESEKQQHELLYQLSETRQALEGMHASNMQFANTNAALEAQLADASYSLQAIHSEREIIVHDLQTQLFKAREDSAILDKGRLSVSSDAKLVRSQLETVSKQCDQYLKAIQDVSFVMKTVTDKFISPNNSEANSRSVSIEDDGPEAILHLEKHVKAILRLVEAVSDKAKIIEKENASLEEKVAEYEHLNSSLRERANQPLIQRLIEPIISCRWSGQSATERILQHSQGIPVKYRSAAEMSQVSGAPPRQNRSIGKD